MKKNISCLAALAVVASMGIAQAATFTVTTAASDGAGSFAQAIRDTDASADPANTIAFNISGPGPFRIAPPPGGFPLFTKGNTTVDGYSQPGSSVNTRPITQTNNAVIKIILDASNGNFRDMAYVFYGTLSTSDPVIDNSSMAGSPAGTNPERGGFGPNTVNPYTPGEVAILGIYRATNVWIKGLALLSDGLGVDYAVAVALDYGLDPAVKNLYSYPAGSCKGFHISGCWIGIDPVDENLTHASSCGIAAYRHRDKGTGGTRPDLSNMENGIIGVAAASANPRAEFNVIYSIPGDNGYLGFEACRYRISGNQFLGAYGTDLGGRTDDPAQSPAVLIGTDGDGVNDADEGNLWPESTLSLYHTGNRQYVVAGNIFGLARDGSRPKTITYAVDKWGFGEKSQIRFGSDFNGVSDALEANTLYDTLGMSGDSTTPTNNAWISMRGNILVNNYTLPIDPFSCAGIYGNFMDVLAITPVITAATTTTLAGSFGTPKSGVAKVVVDIYASDPEGDLAGSPQGKTYLASQEVVNPSAGTFSFTGLTLPSATKVTIAVNYLVTTAAPTITSTVRSGGNTTLTISGGLGTYNILRSDSVSGNYSIIASAVGSPATFVDTAATSFYKAIYRGGSGQTSPFATSFQVP